MKGRQTITLTVESVSEALADYLNKHLREDRAVVVDSWSVGPASGAKTLDCAFREAGKAAPMVIENGVLLQPTEVA